MQVSMAKISESGVITNSGILRMPMDRIDQFLSRYPGQRVIMKIEVAEVGSTEAQLAYYFNYIVPTVQEALRETGDLRTEGQVDLWLRQQCGSCYNDYGGLLKARQMSKSDFSDFIDWIKQFAAENLYIYIEDSKTI